MSTCGDCGVVVGQLHDHGCSVERCMFTGRQWIACGGNHDHGSSVWTGEYPGVAECREFGWYCYEDPTSREYWVQCDATHPKAREDLNRLASEMEARWDRDMEARWDRDMRRWVLL